MPKPSDDRAKSSPTKPSLAAQLRRAVSWHRRKIAALCALLAVFAGLSALTGSGEEMVDVVTAAKSVPAGKQLVAGDLKVGKFPKRYLPDEAVHQVTDLIGRTTVAVIPAGSVLTHASVLGEGSTAAGPGEQLVPIRVTDVGVVNLLRVGDRISVVASTFDGQQSVLAAGVRVAALPQQQSNGPVSESGALVVVAADSSTATRLAGASAQTKLGVVLA